MTEFQDWREQRRKERDDRREERRDRWRNRDFGNLGVMHSKKSSRWTGIFILLIGVAAFLKATITDFPDWVFSWQMILIALGFFIGVRHNFRGVAWFILILIGSIFLLNDWYPDFSFRRYLWPTALIIVGLFIIMRPRRRWDSDYGEKKTDEQGNPVTGDDTTYSKDDFVENVSIFGGAKKIIISKNFKGGDLTNIFGGTELDLMQADFNGTAILDITTIFGGTKLLVPSNWNIKSNAVTIFGGIDDKRKMMAVQDNSGKTLLLDGTVMFGGIEIKSY